ncbi:hypothetical protein AX774_g4235 [Zancudomyces culisetae]|uniref:Uncharacterized protein n=1 Tax=Zancudomyces culisetae TaxID=1213189 RepID=A0A1R1PMV8_ZANCU|nr:hypothetical protein AX774_g4235 [Zancudomyces culisetae]|eukprot:OMH82287.1 hypothetical protein AX774_g4235 [Zancudomyces culisetae]
MKVSFRISTMLPLVQLGIQILASPLEGYNIFELGKVLYPEKKYLYGYDTNNSIKENSMNQELMIDNQQNTLQKDDQGGALKHVGDIIHAGNLQYNNFDNFIEDIYEFGSDSDAEYSLMNNIKVNDNKSGSQKQYVDVDRSKNSSDNTDHKQSESGQEGSAKNVQDLEQSSEHNLNDAQDNQNEDTQKCECGQLNNLKAAVAAQAQAAAIKAQGIAAAKAIVAAELRSGKSKLSVDERVEEALTGFSGLESYPEGEEFQYEVLYPIPSQDRGVAKDGAIGVSPPGNS